MAARSHSQGLIVLPDDDEDPLSPEELRLQRRLFANTQTLPDSYRAWMPDYTVMNAPEIPFSQVTGTRTGIWQKWVPAWTASANPAIGDGTLTGRYAIIGQIVIATLNLTAGSTTTFGTGDWKFSLPTEIAGSFFYLGAGRAFDNSAGGRYAVTATADATNLVLPFDATAGPGSRLSATVPFTWAANDNLYLQVTYEILR